MRDPIVGIRPTHLGFTERPAWGAEGSMIYEFSDQPFTIRAIVRSNYLPREGVHFPEDWRRRLAETEPRDTDLIRTRRSAREAADRTRTFFYSVSAMASSAPDAMEVVDAATKTADVAPVLEQVALPAVPEIPPATEFVKRWDHRLSEIEKNKELHGRWEDVVTLSKDIDSTQKSLPHGWMTWAAAGIEGVQKRIIAEKKILVDVPLAYQQRKLERKEIDAETYIATSAALSLDHIPDVKLDGYGPAHCRVMCQPVRAAAFDDLENQKQVEAARKQFQEEKQKRMDQEKDAGELKRKFADLEKMVEGLKQREEKFKDVTTESVAASLAKTPTPASAAPPSAATISEQSVSAAADERHRKGTMGTMAFMKGWMQKTFEEKGTIRNPLDVTKPGSDMKMRAVRVKGDPSGMPRLEIGPEWTMDE